jgi:hypothetical protein
MAEKVEVTDVSKLAPELLNKSVAQLEREVTERQMAIAELKAREEEKRVAALAGEADEHKDRIVAGLNWLNDNGFLSETVREKFMGKNNKKEPYFAPHIFFRRSSK